MKRNAIVCIAAALLAFTLGGGIFAAAADGADIRLTARQSEAVIRLTAGQSEAVSVADTERMHAQDGSKLVERDNWSYRFADAAGHWTYKLTVAGDTANVTVAAVIRYSDNMNIAVSADGQSWTDVCAPTFDRYGSVLSEKCRISEYDGAFMRYYFPLGRYFDGDTLYVRFGALDKSRGNGIQVADEIVFYGEWLYSPRRVTLTTNSTTVDVTDDELLYFDSSSTLGENNLGWHRFADNDHYFTYLVAMDADKTTDLYMKLAILGLDRGISLSPDNQTFTLVCDGTSSDGTFGSAEALADGMTYYYKLDDYLGTELLDGKQQAVVYVRFHDVDTSDGYGADLYSLQFFNGSIKPDVPNPGVLLQEGRLCHSVSVLDDSIVAQSAGSTTGTYLGEWGRVAAGADAYFVYRVDVPQTATDLSVAMNRINSLLFTVSTDGQTYRSLPVLNSTAAGNGAALTYDLTDLLAESRTLWLRFGGSAGNESMLISLYLSYNSPDRLLSPGGWTDVRYQAFTAGDASETDYRQPGSEVGVVFTGDYRRYDGEAEGVYRFTFGADAVGLNLGVSVGGSFVLAVSKDGHDWTEVAVSERQYCEENWYDTMRELYFSVDALMTDNAERTIWLRVSDPVPDNAFGAALRGVVLEEGLGERASGTEKKGCGSLTTGGFTAGGLLCLALALAAGAVHINKSSKKEEN